MQGFLASFGIKLPTALTGGFNPHRGSYVDILAAIAILAVGILISRGVHQVSRIYIFKEKIIRNQIKCITFVEWRLWVIIIKLKKEIWIKF